MTGSTGLAATASPEPATVRSGSGPPLVLLHATLSSSAELEALARTLSADFTVLRVDRRGSARSAPPPGQVLEPIDVATHVDDLVRVILAAEAGPALVVGHSYGGCLALELAARQPGLVTGAWAYEPPYAVVGPPHVRAELGRIGQVTMEAYRAHGSEAAAEAFLSGVAGPNALAALSGEARARIRARGAAAVADAALLGLDPDGLRRIACPVRIVTGTASRAAYEAIAEGLAARISLATRERLRGADHMAPVTRPAAVAASIRALARP